MEELIELTSKLIQFPSLNPKIDEESMVNTANFIKDWLSDKGIEARIKEYSSGWPTVIAEVGKGKRSVLLNGHFDVVPTGEIKSWKINPFSGKIIDGRIYGRGASDMKSGVAVNMMLLKELADRLDYKLIFTAVSDEETGGFNCSKFLAQDYKPDLVLISEPSGSDSLILGEKGLLQVRLVSKGRAAHGSIPSAGVNAIELLIKDLMNLSKISNLEISLPKDSEILVDNTLRRMQLELGKYIKELRTISFNIGTIKGGVKVNVVADKCEAEVDMRIPFGITYKEAFEKVKSLVENSEIEIIQSSNPNYTSPYNEHAKKLKSIIEKNIKKEVREMLITGATDGRYFREHNIPVLVYGPGKLGQAHVYDEHVEIQDLKLL
ncbi:MAG TPA: ArgE/DapE family deacylase [Geobacterales bacterium]|nr:ArgE/DapE family deacylase [Geobacterales bacterium]